MRRKNTKKIDAIIIIVLILICAAIGFFVTRPDSSTANKGEAQQAAKPADEVTYEDYVGKRVGILTGSSFEENTFEYLPDSEYLYYDSLSDLILALSQNKIDCFVHDEPVLRWAVKEHDDIDYIKKVIKEDNYSFAFQKEGERGELLKNQFNEMLGELSEKGELEKLKDKWFGDDESLKTMDYSGITGENGNVNIFVVSTNIPFCYVGGNNELKGYAVELSYMFCRKYGYKPNFDQVKTAAGLVGISTGKYDMGANSITVTEERKESVRFSDPVYTGGIALAVRTEDLSNQSQSNAKTLSFTDYAGKRIGVQTATTFDKMVQDNIPDANISYFNSTPDMVGALLSGNIDAFGVDEPVVKFMMIQDPEISYIKDYMETYDFGFAFSKTDKGKETCDKFSEYLRKIKSDGSLNKIENIWFGSDESKKVIPDLSELPATNGVLKYATEAKFEPFVYMKDGKIVGYDIDLAYRFCKEYGYGLEMTDMNFDAIVPAMQSGKYDFGSSGMTITEERAQSVYFTEPSYSGGAVIAVRAKDIEGTANQGTAANVLSIKNYEGKKIGVVTGMIFDKMAEEKIPGSQLNYYNNYSDAVTALMSNSIDAFAADEPVVKYMMIENPDVSYVKDYMDEYSFGYCFKKTPEGKELCDKFSEFLKKLKADGSLAEIDSIWFSNNDSKQTIPPLSELNDTNGTLKMGVESASPPFAYMKDGTIVGYDVDIAYRFCKEYGYGLELVDMSFAALIPSVQSGVCDFAASGMTITEERAQSVYFSESNYDGGAVIAVRAADIAGMQQPGEVQQTSENTVKWQDYNGKKIGIITGTSFEDPTFKNFPDSEYLYYNSYSDINVALSQGLIDGYIGDEPALRSIHTEQPQINYFKETIDPDSYAFAFQKDTEKSKKLCEQFNEFLKKAKNNGTLKEIDDIWFGADEAKKVVDFSAIENNPEKLNIVTTSTDTPFSYIKDGKNVGYVIDLAVRFCEEYGYSMDIEDVDFAARIPGLVSGKYDICVSSLAITEERAQSVLFSDPYYNGGLVLAVRSEDIKDAAQPVQSNVKWQDYNGKKIGIMTGSSFEAPTLENLPDSEHLYFNSYSDLNVALNEKKIDAYMGDEPTMRAIHIEQPQIDYIKDMVVEDIYCVGFPKDAENSQKLCTQYNEFLKKAKSEGLFEELDNIWFSADESKKTVDLTELENNPNKLKIGINSTLTPFTYVKDGKYVGYSIDLTARFCKEYGYSMDIEDVEVSALIAGISSAKYDIGVAPLSPTPERKESILFSDPFYIGGIVLAVRSEDLASPVVTDAAQTTEESGGFLDGIKTSFEKNFIREARWKLIVEGIITTLIITLFSTLFGTILAFLICIFRRTESKLAIALSNFYVKVLQGTPIVVLLMILYYIVFGKSGVDAVIVAIVGFSLNLAAYVSEMMRSGIDSIDPGQREAALALGFTERQAFYKFIFPQAAVRFLPVYRGEIVSLLKNTSIVGYIAIQDLTKMSDIIRSRTYEAFFPLIATALIYFLLAWIISVILGKVEKAVTPKSKRK
ncbi:MAG: ABC transporter permease subunit [Firmicutes bacterium]|nr:ABC transporter permease subunit [Bacillota bacterium]